MNYVALLLEDIVCHGGDIELDKVNKLKFLKEQIDLIFMKQIRYTTEALIWASSLFFFLSWSLQPAGEV